MSSHMIKYYRRYHYSYINNWALSEKSSLVATSTSFVGKKDITLMVKEVDFTIF